VRETAPRTPRSVKKEGEGTGVEIPLQHMVKAKVKKAVLLSVEDPTPEQVDA